MDLKQQAQAENAVVNTVTHLQLQTKNPHLEGAMIVADYHLGEIRAVVGGLQTEYAGFNRAFNVKTSNWFFSKTIHLFDRTDESGTIPFKYTNSKPTNHNLC